MAVRDWLDDFLHRHKSRYDPHDWPLLGTSENSEVDVREFIKTWAVAFIRLGITEADADAASLRLGSSPPNFRREHLPAVLAAVAEIRKERNPGGDTVSDRDSAALASKDCPRCCGAGLASAWHPKPNDAEKIPEAVAAYCVCPLGRWILRNHAEKSPDVRKRTPDMLDVIEGRSVWLENNPQLDEGVYAGWAPESMREVIDSLKFLAKSTDPSGSKSRVIRPSETLR